MANVTSSYTLQVQAKTQQFVSAMGTISRSAQGVSGELDYIKKSASEAFSGFGVGDIAQVVAGTKFVTESVDAYAQLVNAQQTAVQVFKEGSAEVAKFAREAADDVGLSERAAIEMTNRLAALGKAAGLGGEELQGFSVDLTKLGADLGAAFNTDTERAVNAIISAMSGSSIEPIREYGIIINDQIIKNELFALTGERITGTLDQQQRSLGITSILWKQSGDYIGQFDREADGLLGTQQRLGAQIENTAASLGQTYAPAAQSALNSTLNLVEGLASVDQATGGLLAAAAGVGALALAFRPVTSRMSAFTTSLKAGGPAAAALGKGLGLVNPALLAGAGLLALNSLRAAQASKAWDEMGRAADTLTSNLGNLAVELESVDTFLDNLNKRDAASRDKPWWDVTGAVTAFRTLDDTMDGLDISEAREQFIEFAEANVQGAQSMLLVAEGGGAAAEELRKYGLSAAFIETVLDSTLTKQERQRQANEAAGDALIERQKALGIEAESMEDASAAGDGYLEVIEGFADMLPEAAEMSREFSDAISELDGNRFARQLDLVTEALGNVGSNFEYAQGVRDYKAALEELFVLVGETGVPSLAELVNPDNESSGELLEVMSQVAAGYADKLQVAFAEGGSTRMHEVGATIRNEIRDGIIEAGGTTTQADEIIAAMGFDLDSLQATIELSATATITDDAKQLLDLALNQGVISLSEYLTFQAELDDPEGVLNGVKAALADRIPLSAEVTDDIDMSAAEDFLGEAGIEFTAEATVDARAEKTKLQLEMEAQGPVDFESEFDFTGADADYERWAARERSVDVAVRAIFPAGGLPTTGTVTPGGGLVGAGRVVESAPVTSNTYINIPTADPSAHMRALEQWSRVNGGNVPILRGR